MLALTNNVDLTNPTLIIGGIKTKLPSLHSRTYWNLFTVRRRTNLQRKEIPGLLRKKIMCNQRVRRGQPDVTSSQG